MSIVLKNLSYIHPDKEYLFENIHLTLQKGDKVGLIGRNGSGKSTLLRLLEGDLPYSGEIFCSDSPYYVPQHFGQYNHLTVAGALKIEDKLKALAAILEGDASEENFTLLNDEWDIEERCLAALSIWSLEHISLHQPLESLSGGEKTKVFLCGLQIHSPSVILMDEPTNHLDLDSRCKLYDFISSSRATILIVSHDVTLLNLLNQMVELDKKGIIVYGGNYDFYKEQKQLQINALQESVLDKEKELRLARKMAREVTERKQKLDVRGKKLSLKKGISRMGMNTLKDKAEKSTSKLKDVHSDKIEELKENMKTLYKELPDNNALKVMFNSSSLHTGKILISAKNIQFGYEEKVLWKEPISFQLLSGDHLLVRGKNGTGKTSLLKLITGQCTPFSGELKRAEVSYLYIDQEYSLIQNELSLYEQLEKYNEDNLPEHELKTLLARFLFPPVAWDKKCASLSGGEKMRLLFCCLTTATHTPDMILLDEPTNNLDIRSSEIILASLKDYRGTLVIVSHDLHFIEEIGVNKWVDL